MTSTSFSTTDRQWMRRALDLARRGAGHVSPNPMVGCVIVSSDGRKIGEGYHERYGEAHAEINALDAVKDRTMLVDAKVYVTLEPCSHTGKTPPCAQALGNLPLERIVVAMRDPNPQVDGDGIQHLRDQGIQVDVGLMKEEAERLNEAFIHVQTHNRPMVILKMAQTADGYIAAPDGHSEWISSKDSRKRVHQWRSVYDAVMVGRTTAKLDNPRLTVRHVDGRQPRRIVLDGPYELDRELQLFSDQYEEKTIVITHNKAKAADASDPMLNMLQPNYFRGQTLLVPKIDGHVDLEEAIRQLGEEDIQSILVEAGSQLASALLRKRLVDKLHLFIAPKLLGGGTRSVLGLNIQHINEIWELHEPVWEQVGPDMLLTAYL
ncbi:MAG: bifunctional diaminohydroxyphosphoribosylaminopyrimidine deaminase/5-amino-6-(5-phosphoribosylamino)uracil reductase RibD [Bacteroidota bacterium]